MIEVINQSMSNIKPETNYVFDTLFEMMRLKYHSPGRTGAGNPSLSYGDNTVRLNQADAGSIHICRSEYWENPECFPVNIRTAVYAGPPQEDVHAGISKIPYIFHASLPYKHEVLFVDEETGEPIIAQYKNTIFVGIDIIANAFYLLTLSFEQKIKKRDDLGRFHRKYNPLDDLYDIPWIDRYSNLILWLFKLTGSGNLRHIPSRWPNDHLFSVALSHDVDRIRTWSLSKIFRILKQNLRRELYSSPVKNGCMLIQSMLQMDSWQGNFNHILKIEKTCHSTFFFSSNHAHPLDPKYRLNAGSISRGISRILNKQSEISLHGSIGSSVKPFLLKQEKLHLEKKSGTAVKGNRFHYLSFDHQYTWENIEKNGFQYDSTLGFTEEPGFRCGTSLPFKPYNQKTKSAFPFWEVPLVIMDTELILGNKMNLTAGESWPVVLKYLEETKRNGGCLTLNFHNTNLNAGDPSGYTALYEKILQWSHDNNGWICSLDELCAWWRDRKEQSIQN